MNAYFIITRDEHKWYLRDEDGYLIDFEFFYPHELVFAETRSKARAMFVKEHCDDFLEPVRIQKVASHVNRRAGFASCMDILWIWTDPIGMATYFETPGELLDFMNDYRDYPAGVSHE